MSNLSSSEPTAFISYARVDGPEVLRLAQQLRAAGVNLWLDQLDINPGQRWDQAVEAALKRCDYMLVILTPTSVESHNVMDEVSYALEGNKRVMPVILEPCEVPFRLRRLQHVDLTSSYDRRVQNLAKALRGVRRTTGSRFTTSSFRVRGQSLRANRLLYPVAAIGLIAVGIVVANLFRSAPTETTAAARLAEPGGIVIRVTPSPTMRVGDTVALEAWTAGGDGADSLINPDWGFSDPSLLTITVGGRFAATKPGSAWITATAGAGVDSILITVR